MVRKTNAEIQKAYRNRKMLTPEYREKERQRALLRRSKPKSESMKAKDRHQTYERVRKYRAKQKKSTTKSKEELTPYRNRSSLIRATSKAEGKLPPSPTKKVAVLQQLAQKYGVILAEREKEKCLVTETDKLIVDFYLRDDISKATPGIKDVVTIKQDGVKTKKQKRYLLYKLREAYEILKAEQDIKICFSRFCTLRPQEVVLSGNTPQDVCLCLIHENFFQQLYSLSKSTDIPNYSSSWIQDVATCEACDSTCNECKDGKLLDKYFDDELDFEEMVQFFRWERSADCKFFRRVRIEMTLEEVILSFKLTLPLFIEHQKTKRHQHQAYEEDKQESNKENIVIQVDFAENFACIEQNEIQSAYWGRNQITLFCVCVWTGENKPESYIVVSDNKTHDKSTALHYLSCILDSIHTEVKSLKVWSDGPTSQFKNRFIAASLTHLSAKYGLNQVEWKYFATAHGKGPVDGIGGAAKRNTRHAILRQSAQVNNARTFAAVAQEALPSVKFLVADDFTVPDFINNLSTATEVKGISKVHYMSYKNGSFSCRKLS